TLPSNHLNDGTLTTNYAVGFNQFTVKVIASSDGGATWSGQQYMNTTGRPAIDTTGQQPVPAFYPTGPDPTIVGPALEHYGFVRQALPQLSVSQGTPSGRASSGGSGGQTGAFGGQLSVAYDQFSFTPQGIDPLRIAHDIRFSRQ